MTLSLVVHFPVFLLWFVPVSLVWGMVGMQSSYCLWSCGKHSTVIFVDTSATDTDPEEPANALASLGKKPVQPKPKGSKQRRVSKTGARLLKTGRLAKSQQLKRDSKLKLTKKEKENVKDALKKQKVGSETDLKLPVCLSACICFSLSHPLSFFCLLLSVPQQMCCVS